MKNSTQLVDGRLPETRLYSGLEISARAVLSTIEMRAHDVSDSIACMLASIAHERRRLALCQLHYDDWLQRHYVRLVYESWAARHEVDGDGVIYSGLDALDKFWLMVLE